MKSSGGDFEKFVNNSISVKYLKTGNFGNKYSKSNGIKKILFFFLRFISLIEYALKGIFYRFKKFDVVVIGLHGLSPKFCINNIKSKKYFQFIRNDLANCDQNLKAQKNILKY